MLKHVGALSAVALMTLGVVAVGGAGAAPGGSQCRAVKGTITIVTTGDPGSETTFGTATGTFAGTISGLRWNNDFAGPHIRVFTDPFTITDRTGTARSFALDFLGNNFTTHALVGGGLLDELTPPAGTYSSIQITLGPQEDFPDGAQPDVFTYTGTRCTESPA